MGTADLPGYASLCLCRLVVRVDVMSHLLYKHADGFSFFLS